MNGNARPLCFVLMPFGTKTDGNKKEINFDTVYTSFIREAIKEAGMEPIRADEEQAGGFIHKPMYERLMFCEFAVADLSFANANVFYELGIRHALKPHTTVSIFETGTKLPFDTAPLRTVPYHFEEGQVKDVDKMIKQVAEAIKKNFNAQILQEDSPIAQLVTGYRFPDLSNLKNNSIAFTSWVTGNNATKRQLDTLAANWANTLKAKAETLSKEELEEMRKKEVAHVKTIELAYQQDLGYNYDVLLALLNAYKSLNAFDEVAGMLAPLVQGPLKDNLFIAQQLGLAYNKSGDRYNAEAILQGIIDKYGPDPETNGLLGAVYKGWMSDHKKDPVLQQQYGRQAIDAYLAGFKADPRDYYPGINALTLMFFHDGPEDQFTKYLPLVTYAVERQAETKSKDYWLQATALELAVLNNSPAEAGRYAAAAITCKPQQWMKQTTAANMQKIYDKMIAKDPQANLQWLKDIITVRLM